MIIINNSAIIDSEEDLDIFFEELNKFPQQDEIDKKTIEIVRQYFIDCYNANVRLTQMVSDLFGEEQVFPIVILNFGECDDFNEINFSLLTEDEDFKVKKREELKYYDFCDICFGSIVGLQDRLDIFFKDYD